MKAALLFGTRENSGKSGKSIKKSVFERIKAEIRCIFPSLLQKRDFIYLFFLDVCIKNAKDSHVFFNNLSSF